jgi:hypothetical protein
MGGWHGFGMMLLWYAGPFIALGLIWLAIMLLAVKWEHKYPKFYKANVWIHDNAPKILGVIVVLLYLYYTYIYPFTT